MTDPSATIGPLLRAARERRGLSSQKAADELHLDGWVIDALEAEDYERIGPSVYVKGHLKRYAALLGVPCAQIMTSYESRAQGPKAPPPQPANVRVLANSADVSNLPLPQIVGSVAAVLLILGVLWWKPWHQRGVAPSSKQPPAAAHGAIKADSAAPAGAAAMPGAPMPAAPVVALSPPAVGTAAGAAAGTGAAVMGAATARGPASDSAAAASAVPSAAVPAAEPNATAAMGRARLRLSFSADSWVDVHDAAGRRVFAGNVRAKSVRTIAGIAPMRVYLRSASAVQLQINNRAVAIAPQFLAGDAAHFEAGADGVLRRDSRSAATPGAPARSARPNG